MLTTKPYLIFLSFLFLTHFLLRGLRWAVLRAWTQNHPKVVGTYAQAITPQPIGQNRVFKFERPRLLPPLKIMIPSDFVPGHAQNRVTRLYISWIPIREFSDDMKLPLVNDL